MKQKSKGNLLLLSAFLFSSLDILSSIAGTHFSSQVLTGMELGSMNFILKMLALAAVAMFSGIAFRILSVAARVGYLSNGVVDIRGRIMKSILSRPMRVFCQRDDSYYLNLLGEDTELYRNNRLNMVPYMFSAFVSVAANAGMLFFLHPMLFLVGVVASVIPLLTANLFTKATQEKRNLVSRTAENYTGILKEGIEGYETLRFSKGQEPFLSRFSSANRKRQKRRGTLP